MAKRTQSGHLLADRLTTDGKLAAAQVGPIVSRLVEHVQRLHASGQLHRDIRCGSVWIDQHDQATLQAAPADPLHCGAMTGEQNLPPELELINELWLPTSIDTAKKDLWKLESECDPRRIDIYQLASLALELLTADTVLSYLIDPEVKAAVPSEWQQWIDSAIGYDPADRWERCEQLQLGLQRILAVEPTQHASPTPPAGTGVDVHRDTPVRGHASVAGSAADLPFATLGDYRIDAKLGSGGMGDVYLGYDPRLDRTVAIKVLPRELSRNPDFVQRFTSEARAAGKLVHPHIVPIYFIGEDSGYHFFAMEHVKGPSLAELLKRQGKLSVERALELVEQVTNGLAEAHDQGLIHRDIKPGNILLDGQSNHAKLADFGLVKSLGSSVQATATGVVMGTVDYISPEQGRGQAVDGRADLYSVGVLLYHLISGKLPFAADSPTAMIFQHAYEKPTPLSEVADVPAQVEALVDRLMLKDPAQRYQSAQSLVDDLRRVRAGDEVAFEPAVSVPTAYDAERPSQIVLAPDMDFLDQPNSQPTAAFVPMVEQGWRSRFLAMFNQHAPEALKDLQNTQLQVDGGIAVYVRRRNELAALAQEAAAVEKELALQISDQQAAANAASLRAERTTEPDQTNQARQQQEGHHQTAAALAAQLAEQTEQSETIKLRLTKVDATLQELRSQQRLLLARLETARAGVSVATAFQSQSRPTSLSKLIVVTGLACCLALVGVVSLFGIKAWRSAVSGSTAPAVQLATITKVNSVSAAYGYTRRTTKTSEFAISDFDVTGSDKLVVTVASEIGPPFEIGVTYAGRELNKLVQTKGVTTAGIYILDSPSEVAAKGVIRIDYAREGHGSISPNGVAIHAVALAGTAPGFIDISAGEVGDPHATIDVTYDHSYVIAAAASDNLSNKLPSMSPKSVVSTEAPFVEVGDFNGHGNEMGSALTATAELVDATAQTYTVRFPGLSNRRNRETVVLAAFAPATVKAADLAMDSSSRISFTMDDSWVQLIPTIDPAKDAANGGWRRDGETLVAEAGSTNQPLALPIATDQSYELNFHYLTTSPDTGVRLAFPIGARRAVLRLGYNHGKGVAIDGVDGLRHTDARNPTAHADIPMPVNQRREVSLNVDLTGAKSRLSVKLDGLGLIEWSGDRTEILVPPTDDRHPLGPVPTLATEGSAEVVFSKLNLYQNTGAAKLIRAPFDSVPEVISGQAFALDFRHKSRYVTVDTFRHHGGEAITFEAWLLPREQSGDNRILVLMNPKLPFPNSFMQLAVTDGHWQFRTRDADTNSGPTVTSPEPVAWGRWTHVAGVYRPNQMELYVDGKQVAQSAEYKPKAFLSTRLRIGSKNSNNPAFQGLMSQVRISQGSRYQKDFQPATTFKNDDRVIGLYHLNEGKGNLTYDASGDGHHGVIRYPRWVKQ